MLASADLPTFTAHVITGAGRGKGMGTPTLNLRMSDVPADIPEGIFACLVSLPHDTVPVAAAMHYGPRPVHHEEPSCEVHLLDRLIDAAPQIVTVTVVRFLREVRDFPSEEALKAQIAEDIVLTRSVLQTFAQESAQKRLQK